MTHLGIYPRERKLHVHTKSWSQKFVAALCVIAKQRQHPLCPSVGDKYATGMPGSILISEKEQAIDACNDLDESSEHHAE